MKALTFSRFGGPEVLSCAEVPAPECGPAEVVIRTAAIGLNFADVYRRQGRYHLEGAPPWIAGYEAAGVVETAGNATGFKRGDRVAFADVPFANAELVAAAVDRVIPLPDDISFQTAAAVLLQGLTAHYLCRDSYRVKPGQLVLLHAAAGGVGLLLIQMCKIAGAAVIAVVSSAEKQRAVKEAGADHVVMTDSWSSAAEQFGAIDVIYDSVGSTLTRGLELVRRGGTVVFYGMAGGDPAPVDPRLLMDGSKTLTGGDLWNVLTSREERIARAAELFAMITSGRLKVRVDQTFPLCDGAAAHRYLESRRSIGKIVLIP
jgi:NADPH2:quinone reductase